MPCSAFLVFSDECNPLPAGYSEALEVHKILAVNLLSQAITGEKLNRCWDCKLWSGRCLKNRRNRIAADLACPEFEEVSKIG